MTATAWPIAAKMKPRECIKVWAIGPKNAQALAELRLSHPGGPPDLMPTAWSGAFESGRLVAALGWLQEKPKEIMVTEVLRTEDHWGAVGTLVLVRSFIEACENNGTKLQALILPTNTKLKEALTREGAECVIEVWMKVKR